MAGKKGERGVKDSGISDLDWDFVRKARLRRSVDLSEDDFTPITNLTDLGPAISAIKRGQDKTAIAVGNLSKAIDDDIKPKLNHVHDGFIRLETEHKVSKARIKGLEDDTKKLSTSSPQAHDCYHEDDFVDLKEGQKGVMAEVISVKTGLATATTEHKRTKETTDKDVARIDGRTKTVAGVAVTIVLFVLTAAGAAGAAFWTVQANVGHLSQEQTKIRDEVSKMRTATVSASSKVESAANKVENLAERVGQNGHTPDPLEAIWCDLSVQERRRQARLRGSDKIPQRRCP